MSSTCYFCCSEIRDSYWQYYCKPCTQIKAFTKLVGPKKLVETLRFQINTDKVRGIQADVCRKLEEIGCEGVSAGLIRKSERLANKNKYDMNESIKTTDDMMHD